MKCSGSLVSVITSFYNDGLYIKECVESVANSDYKSIEHIIIDDGSTDSFSINVLEQIESTYNVKVIRQKNMGVCEARNNAIAQATGRYILPLDADDLISSEYIRLAAEKLDADPALKLVATSYKLFGVREQEVSLDEFSMEHLLGRNMWVNCSMFRREDFNALGGYGVYMKHGLEDWEFWIRLMKGGGQVAYVDGVHFFYRIKPEELSRNSSVSYDLSFELYRAIWEHNRDAFANYYPNPRLHFGYIDMQYRLNNPVVVVRKSALSRFWKSVKSIYRRKK